MVIRHFINYECQIHPNCLTIGFCTIAAIAQGKMVIFHAGGCRIRLCFCLCL